MNPLPRFSRRRKKAPPRSLKGILGARGRWGGTPGLFGCYTRLRRRIRPVAWLNVCHDLVFATAAIQRQVMRSGSSHQFQQLSASAHWAHDPHGLRGDLTRQFICRFLHVSHLVFAMRFYSAHSISCLRLGNKWFSWFSLCLFLKIYIFTSKILGPLQTDLKRLPVGFYSVVDAREEAGT